MATEPATMNWRDYVGRFSVEFDVTNHKDVVLGRDRLAAYGTGTPGPDLRRRGHGSHPAHAAGLGCHGAGATGGRAGHGSIRRRPAGEQDDRE